MLNGTTAAGEGGTRALDRYFSNCQLSRAGKFSWAAVLFLPSDLEHMAI